jgi:beta-lactam-binding protein with PASTA domain
MVEPPPRVPPEDPEAETVVDPDWAVRPESQVVVEQTEPVPPPRRRMPTIWPWLLALLVLVLAGLGALYFLSRDDDEPSTTTSAATTSRTTTTVAQQATVPDVVGDTVGEATAAVQRAGFEVNIVLVPSDERAGQVVAQEPAAGAEQEEGESVRLNVAEPAQTTTAPATTAPATTGTTTAPPPTTTAPPATTAPPPPPRPATVPDVVGQELADAARSFADEGLKAAVRYVPSQEAQGRVVAQAQPAGTERKRGDTVQLNISIGAEPQPAATVPRTAGQTLERGRDVLEQAGFEVLALSVGDREVRNESTILSQSPGASASIPRGSLVLVYL